MAIVQPIPDGREGEGASLCADCGAWAVVYRAETALAQCQDCGSIDTVVTADTLREHADKLRQLEAEVCRLRSLLDQSRQATIEALAGRDEAEKRVAEVRRQMDGYRLEIRELRDRVRGREGVGVAG